MARLCTPRHERLARRSTADSARCADAATTADNIRASGSLLRIGVASIFWGLWLFPFAMLVIRSGFIPRVLGILMMIAGAGYLVSSAVPIR